MLTTGNKSEMSTGYATLYGDMAGGFAVLKDITKKYVYRLSRYRNTLSAGDSGARDQPAAERGTAPDQIDQDSLPPYDVLDAIVERYVEQDQSLAEIVAERLQARGRRAGGEAGAHQRIQASPGAGRHPHHPARLRQGLALSDHQQIPGRALA